jgi:hypothetical protein
MSFSVIFEKITKITFVLEHYDSQIFEEITDITFVLEHYNGDDDDDNFRVRTW